MVVVTAPHTGPRPQSPLSDPASVPATHPVTVIELGVDLQRRLPAPERSAPASLRNWCPTPAEIVKLSWGASIVRMPGSRSWNGRTSLMLKSGESALFVIALVWAAPVLVYQKWRVDGPQRPCCADMPRDS